MTLKAHPQLKKTKGNIVNVGSNSIHVGASLVLPYIQSKAAVEQQTRQLAILYSRDRIRVNMIW